MAAGKSTIIKWRNDVFNGQAYAHSDPHILLNDPGTEFTIFFKRAILISESVVGTELYNFNGTEKLMQVKVWLEDDNGQKFGKQQGE
jgi:hypothetical protein